MKKHLFSVLLCAAALLAGCNNQDIEEGADGSGTHFINVTIAMGGSTRADDPTFQDGTGDESDISSITFVFYNEAGNVIASSDLGAVTEKNTSNLGTGVEYNFQVKLTLPVGAQLPKSMMAFANPLNASQVKMLPISEISTQTRSDYKNGGGKFTMTNAVYFESSSPYKQVREVETPSTCYYTKDADAATATKTVIYLERVAAKVKVSKGTSFDTNNQQQTLSDGSNDHTMKFVIDKWGLTCLEKKTYALKYFNPDTYNETFLGEALGASAAEKVFAGWNDHTNHRCYWANSVTYGKSGSEYPSVSDDLLGTSVTAKFLESSTDNANSYNKTQKLNYTALTGMTYEVGNAAYLLENTVSKIYASAMASVVVYGHYVNATTSADIGTFYVIGNTYFTEENLKKRMVLLNKNYLKKNENFVSESDIADFEIVHPTEGLNTSGSGKTKNAESIVTINLKSSSISNYKYKSTDGEWTAVTTSNLSDVNQSIYQNAQVAEAFKDGKAYFVWPIKHLNNDMEHGVGQYGVVRNHVYDITIAGITGLGNGVFNPDIPVVPTDATTNYGIDVTVNVLKWRLVSQEANLKR